MTDPKAILSKAPSAIELATGGALSDLREQLLPDVDARLRQEANKAHEDMFRSLILVARTLVAAAHGTHPSDREVQAFINNAASDPAFAARTMRLLSEGLRTPNERRRRMLALALFRPLPDPEMRDRVDAAAEHLEPTDIEVLRLVAEHDADEVAFLDRTEDAPLAYGHSLGSKRSLHLVLTRGGGQRRCRHESARSHRSFAFEPRSALSSKCRRSQRECGFTLR